VGIFPCVDGPHRFRGPATSLYPALVNGQEAVRWKLRMCSDHAASVLGRLEPYLVSMDDAAVVYQDDAKLCATCSRPVVDDSRQLYVTVYQPKHEREDYWAQIHLECGNPGWLPYVAA